MRELGVKARRGVGLMEHDISYYYLCTKRKLVNNNLCICFAHKNSISRN